ncbi:hypothetical protein [Paenibacillus cremeus]|uniref:SH3 domain-containing protein n=1 Tax=Paenibacillus cremeus TaxID=2163881 RepID=A0A559KI66_9BACL|nr:hypothetical protein [Paenibacillus cremeus]TVY11806.1 hypothetical protein FPZ49_00485 [Paenibacillus cremeus]
MNKRGAAVVALTMAIAIMSGGQASAYSGIDEQGFITTPESLDITVTFMEPEPVYDAAEPERKSGVTLAPQTVHAKAIENAFFKIDTWLGDKWIFPKGRIIYNLEPIQKELALPATTPMFDFPNALQKRLGELSPQTVTAFEQAAGRWYHVRTPQGDGWINLAIALPKEVQPVSGSIKPVGDTLILQYPHERAQLVGVLRNQAVTPLGKTSDNWYHIQGTFGDGWVHVEDSQLPKPVDKLITLNRETEIMDYPMVGNWLGKLAPQQIRATGQWNNWYQIQTWLGEAWIVVDER